MISFKANLVNNTNVKCLNKNGNYKNMPVRLVELEVDSDLDLEALAKVKENWKDGDVYAQDVHMCFEQYHNNIRPNTSEKFYALTSQYGGYENLDGNKILGVAQVYKESGNAVEIEFLQTNPQYKYGIENRKVKHIGKAITQSLKEIFKGNEISLFSTKVGKPFYKKLGFEIVEESLMRLKR